MNDVELKLELNVNGKPIEMNEFVHKINCNILWGILKSIRLEEDPRRVIFTLTAE